MANISYKKSTTEKFDVKGYLDASASTITYIEKDTKTVIAHKILEKIFE